MSRSAKGAKHRRYQGALVAAAVTAMPLAAGLPALASAPQAAAALPGQLGVVTLALYPGRNSDDHGGIMCMGTRTCEPIRYPYLARRVGADDLQAAIEEQTAVEENASEGPMVVFGYSQGARVVGQWLEQHAQTEGAPSPDQLSFVLVGNPDRKYGGAHVSLGDVTPETEYSVIDVTRQYDRASDWPDHPMNLLAFLNANAGLANIHVKYDEVDIYDPANYVWTEGNTTYVFIPTENIPLLEPLRKLGLTELADKLNGPLKAKIEEAYDRSYLPDQPGWPVEPEPEPEPDSEPDSESEPEAPQQDPAPVESASTTLMAARTVQTSASDERSSAVPEDDNAENDNAEKDAQDEANAQAGAPIDDAADDDAPGDNSVNHTSDEDAPDAENKDAENKENEDKKDTSDKQEANTSSADEK